MGRRMGANQLVVLNVYDMVSAAPGDRRRPALSGVWTPAWCFLPRAPASSLVLRDGGRGQSRCLLIRRLAGTPPGGVPVSPKEGLGSSLVPALSCPGCGPDPWADERCPIREALVAGRPPNCYLASKLLGSPLPCSCWPLSVSKCSRLPTTLKPFKSRKSQLRCGCQRLPKGEQEPIHPHLQGILIKMNEAKIHVENSAVELFRDHRGDPRI